MGDRFCQGIDAVYRIVIHVFEFLQHFFEFFGPCLFCAAYHVSDEGRHIQLFQGFCKFVHFFFYDGMSLF